MTLSSDSLSIVVAGIGGGHEDLANFGHAIERELRAGDEVIWTGPVDPPNGLRVERIAPSADGGRGDLYGHGLAVARNPHVAFTDSKSVLRVGWRCAVDLALSHAAGVGGPVLPGVSMSTRSWAGFFVEYGPHASPPYLSRRGDVAANNVAFRRADLLAVVASGGPVWKSEVSARMHDRGMTITVEQDMAVTVTKDCEWSDLTTSRLAHGRLHGAQQARQKSVLGRLVAAAGCAVLPPVAYCRLLRVVFSDERLRREFIVATPLVGVALVAWSIGEAIGYVTAQEGQDVVY